MEDITKILKMPAIIGVCTALTGGVLNKATGWKTGVELKMGSLFKSFLLVTSTATAIELTREETKSKISS